MTRAAIGLIFGLILGLPLAAASAHAQSYPSRPIRLVIPSVPGGVHDVIGRIWAEQIKTKLGTVVLDNRGGAGGVIGATDVAHAAPDGYTLLLGSTTTHALVPPTLPNPPYDPLKDFATAAVFANSSTSVVVHPSVPATTLTELIAYAKANPGRLSYGSAGNGSITNLSGELFKQRAGHLDIVHVPYKGIGQIVGDLIGGQIPMSTPNATAQILDLYRAGRVRILSINAERRLKAAPDIPTSIEAGLPDMVAQTYYAIFAPAGTPRDVVAAIDAATQDILRDPAFQTKLIGLGFEPMPGIGADRADAYVRQEYARWLPVVKASGAK